jgi:membrane-associated phospholipid phosphatase
VLVFLLLGQALCPLENDVYTIIHHEWQWKPATYAMKGVSYALHPAVTLGIPPVCYLCDDKDAASADLMGFLSTCALVIPLKYAVNRQRPEGIYQRWDSSFPSGHTAIAFSHAYILSHHYPKAKIPLFLVASTVGFSRLYLGKHYPTDVIAGAVIGLAVGYLTTRFTK